MVVRVLSALRNLLYKTWSKEEEDMVTTPGGYFQNLGGVRHASWNPYPISDQNLWFSLPYFIPDQKFDTPFRTRP